ncbi:MAG: MqnA/MqnD/SBP family protein [Thermoanaerobaculia bacterium]
MKQKITLAHSPDADDAFMFYALAKDLIDSGEFQFEHHLKDIQSLNIDARSEVYDVTAISFAMYPSIADRYALLSSGASIGDGYGPLVVSRKPMAAADLDRVVVAVPGLNTSAYLGLKLFAPKAETTVMDFDQIQGAVKEGRVEAGLIIHEGQITYAGEGLHKVVDLGEWWKKETNLPMPLGGNVVRRALGKETIAKVSAILKKSIQFSLDHRKEALEHAMSFGRGLDTPSADRFVGMYVNDYTVDYGEKGRAAVRLFLDRAHAAGLVGKVDSYEFY